VPLRNILVVPPGGFRYTQAATDRTPAKNFHTMNDAWSLAVQVANFRAGNGLERATPKEALKDIDDAQCERLHNDPAHCIDADKKKGVRAAIDRLSRSVGHAAVGGRVLIEWLGEGAVPVPIEVAQRRANVCLECPENRDGHSLLRLTADAVRAIAEQMNAKEHLKLRVEGEDRLHACAICRCPLPLKVHVPLNNILQHTDEATLNAFPPFCWIAKEGQVNIQQ